MKRALAVLIAVLAILLVYPATAPSAKSPVQKDTPTKIHLLPPGPTTGNGDFGNSGEEDEGDGDDLAGIKPGTRPDGGGGGPGGAFVSGYYPAGPQAKVWWMYFMRYVWIVF